MEGSGENEGLPISPLFPESEVENDPANIFEEFYFNSGKILVK
jgi:hypothetical protein